MKRDINPPQCLGCHFSNYTGSQKAYAEEHGTPLSKASQKYCQIRTEYVFKDYSCYHFVERHQEIR